MLRSSCTYSLSFLANDPYKADEWNAFPSEVILRKMWAVDLTTANPNLASKIHVCLENEIHAEDLPSKPAVAMQIYL